MLNIKTVSVIGANGTMGAAVAGLVAAFGNAKVFLVCRKMEAAEKAVEVSANSVKADSLRSRLIPKSYDQFEECVSQSDWVFESVAEDPGIKAQIYQKISAYAKPELIVTTGTSGFSINMLSENFSEKIAPRYFGSHFFNPPYSLTLCEMIRSKKTDAKLFGDMREYLEKTLYRDVVEVADAPAFLGNRIGFHFMNKALQYAEKYQNEGGIDYIDAILGPFTGRGMSPIATVDFVGLDVHKAIVDNIREKSKDFDNEAFALPEYVARLIAEGKLGRKSKDGLFKMAAKEDGSKQLMVYDIATKLLRPNKKYVFPFAQAMVKELRSGNYAKALQSLKDDTSREGKLCKYFLALYIIYSIVITEEVSPQITDADIAMSTGFNWIGPVALMQALGGYDEVLKIAGETDPEGKLVSALRGIKDMNKKAVQPPLDYRKFLRANL